MSQDSGQRNFTVGQSGTDVAIRLRTTKTSENGTPELDTTKRILSQRRTHLLTTYDGSIKNSILTVACIRNLRNSAEISAHGKIIADYR